MKTNQVSPRKEFPSLDRSESKQPVLPSTAQERKVCGAQTKAGQLCRQTILPCVRHTVGFQRRPKWTSPKKFLLQGILEGKSVAQAARNAGYSKSSIKGTIYRIIKRPEIQEQIEALLKAIRSGSPLAESEMARPSIINEVEKPKHPQPEIVAELKCEGSKFTDSEELRADQKTEVSWISWLKLFERLARGENCEPPSGHERFLPQTTDSYDQTPRFMKTSIHPLAS